jgi:hypothetical protein
VKSYKNISSKKAELVLVNSGTVHRVLKGIHLYELDSSSKRAVKKKITGLDLNELESENILPEKTRRFIIKARKGAQISPVGARQKVEVEFDSQ